MPQLSAAYGLFYLDNRPVVLRALDVDGAPAETTFERASAHGFNAIRSPEPSAALERRAGAHDLAIVGPESGGAPFVGTADGRPFGVGLQAERAGAGASATRPAALWGMPDSLPALAAAVARGVRGYSVRPPAVGLGAGAADGAVERFHAWLAAHEEELTASIAVRDPVALIDYRRHDDDSGLEGGLGALVCAGYNPTLIELGAASDADLAEFPAAVFPTQGFLTLDDYGKLVVLVLRGATLVTYPEPVRRMPDGTPFRTTFLWPERVNPPRRASGRVRQVGYRVQVRDGVSTLLGEPLGEPYAGPAYYRLPEGQRRAHRDLVLGLLGDVASRHLAPERGLEIEAVARLSPEGGALLFVVNRLGVQRGAIALPSPEALNVEPPVRVEVLFAGGESRGEADGEAVHVDMAPCDVLILRLG